MQKELQAIFESLDKDLFNEETINQINTIFESTVQAKVKERVELEVKAALSKLDEDHADKMKKLITAIDKDHTAKVKAVVEKINRDHLHKLNIIKEKYEKVINKQAIEHKKQLVESIDLFLDHYIDKAIPKKVFEEAAKNNFANKVLKEAQSILGIDNRFINKNVRAAIKEGKEQMDALIAENAQLKKEKALLESHRILSSKIKNLPIEKAKFVKEQLSNKPASFIEENFTYVSEMYDRLAKTGRQSALNSVKPNVDRKKVADELLKEQSVKVNPDVVEEKTTTHVDFYLEGMTSH